MPRDTTTDVITWLAHHGCSRASCEHIAAMLEGAPAARLATVTFQRSIFVRQNDDRHTRRLTLARLIALAAEGRLSDADAELSY